jgi:hypothetical protein
VALSLINRGVKNVRPLQGGLTAWLEASYPSMEIDLTVLVVSKEEPDRASVRP